MPHQDSTDIRTNLQALKAVFRELLPAKFDLPKSHGNASLDPQTLAASDVATTQADRDRIVGEVQADVGKAVTEKEVTADRVTKEAAVREVNADLAPITNAGNAEASEVESDYANLPVRIPENLMRPTEIGLNDESVEVAPVLAAPTGQNSVNGIGVSLSYNPNYLLPSRVNDLLAHGYAKRATLPSLGNDLIYLADVSGGTLHQIILERVPTVTGHTNGVPWKPGQHLPKAVRTIPEHYRVVKWTTSPAQGGGALAIDELLKAHLKQESVNHNLSTYQSIEDSQGQINRRYAAVAAYQAFPLFANTFLEFGDGNKEEAFISAAGDVATIVTLGAGSAEIQGTKAAVIMYRTGATINIATGSYFTYKGIMQAIQNEGVDLESGSNIGIGLLHLFGAKLDLGKTSGVRYADLPTADWLKASRLNNFQAGARPFGYGQLTQSRKQKYLRRRMSQSWTESWPSRKR
ncbi:hypothetical protein [Blastopirellula marina]|uniref:Uncharacterized protein n=1 Tax=Blastopirellula marina DSM 3645 TaxID=314230 RepID=A3ZX30_9BACT|nr:hypothetical protein [Blastopirellula marina]EAQ78907.1 hypothetical protein DSM3645_27543 [Blastopirellula marina DSM 3645]